MKTTTILFLSCFGIGIAGAQEKATEEGERRVETIRIVNGDTVMHDVQIKPAGSGKQIHIMNIDSDSDGESVKHYEIDVEEILESVNEKLEDLDISLDEIDAQTHRVQTMVMDLDLEGMGDSINTEIQEHLKELEIQLDDVKNNMNVEIEEEDGKRKVIVYSYTYSSDEDEPAKKRSKRKIKKAKASSGISTSSTGLTVYPNPTDGQFKIQLNMDSDEPGTLTVYDSAGKKYLEKTVQGSGMIEEVIDIGDAKGIFIVQFNQKRRSETRKIVIE